MLKQKLRHGNLVHIKNGSCEFHFKQGCDAIILGSYNDFFGSGDIFQYAVMFEDGGKSSWYHDNQLTLLDEGGEHLIELAQERMIRKEARTILLNRNLDHMYESDIVTLLRFIGFDYSISNNYFGLWKQISPIFKEIKLSDSPNVLYEKYPEYDIKTVWDILHKKEDDHK